MNRMTLAEALSDWTDWDFAAYRLGQALGLFTDKNFHVDTKYVFWTNNPLGDGLHTALLALVDAQVLEHRDEPDDQFRWASAPNTTEPGPYVVEDEHVMITYTNHRNETAVRRIRPLRMFYGSTEWHPEPQWLLEAHDFARVATRTFAMKNITQWNVYERPE